MTPPAEMSGQHETARQQSRAAWGAVASGWYVQREELWKASRPVSEGSASGSPVPVPPSGGPAIVLPAAVLLLGSGILTYAILRRR